VYFIVENRTRFVVYEMTMFPLKSSRASLLYILYIDNRIFHQIFDNAVSGLIGTFSHIITITTVLFRKNNKI